MTQKSNANEFTGIRKPLLLSTTTLTLASMIVMASPVQAQVASALETPTGEVVVGGGASFSRPTVGQLNVTQNSQRLIVDWDSFNIGKGATVAFDQKQGASSIAVNRVTSRSGDPTKIRGRLTANGRLVVLDPNGVVFGKNSVVDVAGLVASTGTLQNERGFMNKGEKLVLGNTDARGYKKVVNLGTINLKDSGLLAFVAPYASNQGVINANLGKVTLAAGKKVTVDLTGDQLVSFTVNKKLAKALAENSGTINAAGGRVTLTANAAKGVVDDVINMSGVIRAQSFGRVNGKIVLNGRNNGRVKVTGELDASTGPIVRVLDDGRGIARQGGVIEIDGEKIRIKNKAILNATGENGGGSISVGNGVNAKKAKSVVSDDSVQMLADAIVNGNGGKIIVNSELSTLFNSFAAVRGGKHFGNGGTVEVSSDGDLGFHGSVNTSAGNGALGTLILDPRVIKLWSGFGRAFDTSSYVVNASRLADVLGLANVNVVATKAITAVDDLDFRSKMFKPGTGGNLLLDAPTLNLKNVQMGGTHVTFDTDTLNLGGRIFGADKNLIKKRQFRSTTGLVNVLSSQASIQQGIDLVNDILHTDATVRVSNKGEYHENININKSITLKGLSKKGPILMGTRPDGTVVRVTADNVVFDNFRVRAELGGKPPIPPTLTPDKPVLPPPTIGGCAPAMPCIGGGLGSGPAGGIPALTLVPAILNSQVGLSMNGQNNVVVKNSNFNGFDIGVRVKNSGHVDVLDNNFKKNNTGLKIKDSNNVLAKGNIFNGLGHYTPDTFGIFAKGGKKLFVIDNEFYEHDTAIFAKGVDKRARIAENTIDGAFTGIDTYNMDKLRIVDNTLTAVYYGIGAQHVERFLKIARNTVDGAKVGDRSKSGNGFTGIYVHGADDAKVKRNTVRNFESVGIVVEDSDNTLVKRNTVEDITFGDAFVVDGSDNAFLTLNTARNPGGNGFSILNSDDVEAFDNRVYDAGGLLRPTATRGLMVNCLMGCGENSGHGFYVENSRRARIIENDVFGARGDGVHVTAGNYFITAAVMGDGARKGPRMNSNGARVLRNNLYNLGDDGVDFNGISFSRANGNLIENAAGHGIESDGGRRLRFNRNRIVDAGMNGINVFDTYDSIIRKNRIIDPAFNGIELGYSDMVTIDDNRIRMRPVRKKKEPANVVPAQTMMTFKGYYFTNYGIYVHGTDGATVTNNIVKRFDKGIVLEDVGDAFVGGNTVKRSRSIGLHAMSPWNDDITLSNNVFENNNIGALFNSGLITLGGVNQFLGGETGMIFSPFFFEQEINVARIANDGPGQGDVEESDFPRSRLSLVGNTLGQTVFAGQTGNYIELRNGALFDPGQPTVIDGVGATFDGVSGAALTQAELDAIEDKIVDFDDKDTLGQIFVGFVPNNIQQEDILRQILSLLGFTGGDAGVIITGLPQIPGAGNTLASLLNALSPAAGDETDPEDLNNIDPAAGGDDSTMACWGQLGNVISSGSNGVTFNLGEDPSKILSDIAACSL